MAWEDNTLVALSDAGHWVHHDELEVVTETMKW